MDTRKHRVSQRLAAGLAILLTIAAAQGEEVRKALPVESGAQGGRATLDDTARFLAGLPGNSGSPFKRLESTGAWREHSKAFDDLWRRVQAGRHVYMRRWALSEVLPRVPRPRTIYYLFGGPDFVTVQVFFPGTPTFILGGLEPVGQVPDLNSLSADQLTSSLRNLRQSMDGVLRLGFFETKDMRADLNRTPVQGVKPILYASLARSGDRLISESYFTLNSNGSPSYTSSIPKGSVTGLKIDFQPVSGGGTRTVYYLNANVANGALENRVLRFLEAHGPAGSYLKAASYLMHEGNFSNIRNFLLNNSTFILEDDSGIPLKYFDRSKWDLVFFGNYRGVMRIFSKYFQPDLREIYARGAAREMPFGIGYRTSDAQASQILAIRTSARAAASSDNEPPTARAIPVR